MKAWRIAVTVIGLLLLWQAVVWATAVPPFILPGPYRVVLAGIARWDVLAVQAVITGGEIVLGMVLGVALGMASGALLVQFAAARRWLLPLLIASQAVPVFAVAPLLVLWLGYGMASKIAMAGLVIFFPVSIAFFDGLRRADPAWLDLGRTMNASSGALLWQIRLPAALPALASGIRVAAAIAPIGAVVGEWVGASAGLGYLMTMSLARAQTDTAFAALAVLSALGLALYFVVDRLLRSLVPWQSETVAEPT
jgi:putative hydroxymethylpyrimidine transport system permease protein